MSILTDSESRLLYLQLSDNAIAEMDKISTESDYKIFSMLKPEIYRDGNKWCVLYGSNIKEGICGFGDSPLLAIKDFNKAMIENI